MTVKQLKKKLEQYPEDWKILIQMVQKDLNEENVFEGDELLANHIYCAGQGEVCLTI